ncbi:MAG TPA: DUF1109 domain-containing protein [Pararobbsia sp.]|nr:DUF1109 domain-containing protein [Pararobbsia sp.]
MRTSELIDILSTGEVRADPHRLTRRFAVALFAGLGIGTLELIAIDGFRSDMPDYLLTSAFLLKAAFPLAVVAGALFVAMRLARPGARLKHTWVAVAWPVVAIWVASAWIVLSAPPEVRLSLMLGTSWRTCTLNIVLLSMPSLFALFYAMRGLAPTRLATAGAAVGLLAGAQGTLVYMLYCVENAVPFWGLWYALGIAVSAGAGALLGPRYLRW